MNVLRNTLFVIGVTASVSVIAYLYFVFGWLGPVALIAVALGAVALGELMFGEAE